MKEVQVNNKKKIIISGGGTGGHIFPAISIADTLKEKFNNEVEIHFVGAKGKMEMQKIPEAGYSITGLWISGFQRNQLLKNILLPLKIIVSFMKAHLIIQKHKPHVVVGVGGYASAMIMKVASQYKIPTLIQEQNSYPGITNKILAGSARKICVAYDGMEKYFPASKIVLTGNPIRKNICELPIKSENIYNSFKLDSNKKTILITGGSLGALNVNKAIHSFLNSIPTDTQIIWQTGKNYYNSVAELNTENASIHEFITNMSDAYAIADVIISRAGAGSISELCIVGKPVILVPSPNVTEDHQTKNALALVKKNAALLVKDVDANATLMKTAIDLLDNIALKNTLQQNIKLLAKPDAANEIVKEILKLIPN